MKNEIIYIMGVSGSGKTTVGSLLSKKTGIPFFDGDDFHPNENKAKMAAGIPLTDADRREWLREINLLAQNQKEEGAIIACSALKEKYRYVLSEGVKPFWVFLTGSFELISERMKNRDHFMPVKLLSSQFNDLETPAGALVIDITRSPEEIVHTIMDNLATSD